MTRRSAEGSADELDRLRAAAAEKVRSTELTALSAILSRPDDHGSRSIGGGGMSPAEMKRFLFGYDPPARNKRADHIPSDAPVPAEPGGEIVVLGVLVRDLPPVQRQGAIVTLLDTIASFYRRAEVSVPEWFTDAAMITGSDELNEWVDRCEFVSR
jgi:hypothetical protein